jgi:hypothetical protein
VDSWELMRELPEKCRHREAWPNGRPVP